MDSVRNLTNHCKRWFRWKSTDPTRKCLLLLPSNLAANREWIVKNMQQVLSGFLTKHATHFKKNCKPWVEMFINLANHEWKDFLDFYLVFVNFWRDTYTVHVTCCIYMYILIMYVILHYKCEVTNDAAQRRSRGSAWQPWKAIRFVMAGIHTSIWGHQVAHICIHQFTRVCWPADQNCYHLHIFGNLLLSHQVARIFVCQTR